MVVDTVRIQLDDLFVLIDGQASECCRTRSTRHVAEGTKINAAEDFVGFEVIGITFDDVLRFFDTSAIVGLDVCSAKAEVRNSEDGSASIASRYSSVAFMAKSLRP